MRLLALAGIGLSLGSCGTHARSRPASGPPPIVLTSAAGAQTAVAGSYCGQGSGVCADSIYPAPRKLTVVRPRDSVRIAVDGATAIDLNVHRPGCERTSIRHVVLRADGGWRVDLPPGSYDLQVFARFALPGRSGD